MKFGKINFKIESHGTIYIFKNYFTIVFSVFSNKWYLNRPSVSLPPYKLWSDLTTMENYWGLKNLKGYILNNHHNLGIGLFCNNYYSDMLRVL